MDRETYCLLENYMLSCMEDSAHDKEHIYRVLYHGLEIAKTENHVDYDVLIAACLLHDIGRREQFENPALCHAIVGGRKAYNFLTEHGIETHRYRQNQRPESPEAKILFDADKLDATGAMGIARTLIYKGIVSEPIYSVLPDGRISDAKHDQEPSFFQEYKYKLEGLYSGFYTKRAAQIAGERQRIAVDFYNCLYQEASFSCLRGREELERQIKV